MEIYAQRSQNLARRFTAAGTLGAGGPLATFVFMPGRPAKRKQHLTAFGSCQNARCQALFVGRTADRRNKVPLN